LLQMLVSSYFQIIGSMFRLQNNNEISRKQWFSNPVAACCR